MANTNTQKISPQGYNYEDDPLNTNPFWGESGETPSSLPIASKTTAGVVKIGDGIDVTADGTISVSGGSGTGSGEKGEKGDKGDTGATPDISMTATVSETTGTPTVEITKSGTAEEPSFALAFSGLKGETGAPGPQGETGATGATGETGPQGPQGEAGKDGTSPTVTSTGSTESGALAGTITGADGNTISVYNGAKGADGSASGEIDTSQFLTNVSMTNENGVYYLKETKGGVESDIGTIEVPSVDTTNVLAEITDSVIEDATNKYDFHTLKETEYNGTQNEVGKFYLAQEQITGASIDGTNLNFSKVSQDGTMSTQTLALPTTGGTAGEKGDKGDKGDTGATPDISMTATVSETTGTPAVEITKSGTAEAPSFALAFSGLKGETGATGATGETGPQGPQGEAGKDGTSPTVTSTGSTESGALAGTITGADGNTISVYNGAKGADGSASGGSGGGGITLTAGSADITYNVGTQTITADTWQHFGTPSYGTLTIGDNIIVDNILCQLESTSTVYNDILVIPVYWNINRVSDTVNQLIIRNGFYCISPNTYTDITFTLRITLYYHIITAS